MYLENTQRQLTTNQLASYANDLNRVNTLVASQFDILDDQTIWFYFMLILALNNANFNFYYILQANYTPFYIWFPRLFLLNIQIEHVKTHFCKQINEFLKTTEKKYWIQIHGNWTELWNIKWW